MEMNFAKQSIESFVQDLNSTKPMPGGGSAAAICGAMGAALAGMSAHMTAGKKKYVAVEEKMQEIITATKILQEEMLAMAYERTCLNTGGLNWAYMNKILQRWHEQGFHTAEAVKNGDNRGGAPKGASGQLGAAELEAIQRVLREG